MKILVNWWILNCPHCEYNFVVRAHTTPTHCTICNHTLEGVRPKNKGHMLFYNVTPRGNRNLINYEQPEEKKIKRRKKKVIKIIEGE